MDKPFRYMKTCLSNYSSIRCMALTLLVFCIVIGCDASKTGSTLQPKIEFYNNDTFKWEQSDYPYNQLDSILSTYKSSIPANLHDSIDVQLIVHSKKITMQNMDKVKVVLRKNDLLRITYHTPKQR